jgi:hypothetical protein
MSDEVRLISQTTGDTYISAVGNKIAVIKIENNVMMTVKEIAQLYGVSTAYIRIKLKKLFILKTLNKKRVSNRFTHRANDGKLYETRYYNADAIVAIGLSIKSPEAIAFQEWLGAPSIKQIKKA